MQIQIDQTHFNLSPNKPAEIATTLQAQTLDAIAKVAITCSSISAKALSNHLGLRSSLPLWSRLKHLEEKGWIQQVEASAIA
jgi:ribosomal protein S25